VSSLAGKYYVPGSGACVLESGSRQRSALSCVSRFYSPVEQKNSEELEENMSLNVKDRFSITDKKNLYTCFQREVKRSALACVHKRMFSLCKSQMCHA
jgi:hypothetical protein